MCRCKLRPSFCYSDIRSPVNDYCTRTVAICNPFLLRNFEIFSFADLVERLLEQADRQMVASLIGRTLLAQRMALDIQGTRLVTNLLLPVLHNPYPSLKLVSVGSGLVLMRQENAGYTLANSKQYLTTSPTKTSSFCQKRCENKKSLASLAAVHLWGASRSTIPL